jgi:hypothetical protein
MRYTTTVLTEFDQELFDECYADCDDDMWVNFPREVFNQAGANDYDTRKAAVAARWQSKVANTEFISYKVTDTATDIDMSYAVARLTSNSVDVMYVMYKCDQQGSKSWVRDYWVQNFCNQERSISTQLGKLGWRAFVVGKKMEDFIVSLGVKKSIILRKDNNTDTFEKVVPEISQDSIPGTENVVFLSPWGWTDWQYEDNISKWQDGVYYR